MENIRVSRAPVSIKLLMTSLICISGLIYLVLLYHIFQDCEMKPSLIAKGYCSMEALELTDHAHKYLPYYSIYIFLIPTLLFMFTSFSEKIKRIFAVLPYILIVIDIASMCLIALVSKSFSWVLFFAGMFLAFTFLLLFSLLMYDIWFRKAVVK
ncbi:MAG: hypothetical protein PHY94_04555 [Candidatus Omnitrophica bacterium]|nr:hypothetical protein [Candidatus Omnitrophota bacterium]